MQVILPCLLFPTSQQIKVELYTCKCIIYQAWGQDDWILPNFCLTKMKLQSIKMQKKLKKKRTRPIWSHVDQTSLVKNRFLMCMSNNGCFSCGANASNPELARYKRPILPSWVANQNSGFSSPCPQVETAFIVNKRLWIHIFNYC